jgi:hypothetical protein
MSFKFDFRSAMKRTIIGGSTVVGLPLGVSVIYSLHNYFNTPKDQISELHTPYSIYVQSLTHLFMTELADLGFHKFQKSCTNAAKVNEDLLLSLLDRCKNTKYGTDYNLSQIRTRDEFRNLHPITRLDHYKPYIDQIVHYGQHDSTSTVENIMFPEKPRMIAETSGTSGGARKLIPVPSLQRKVFFTDGIAVTFHALMQGVGSKVDDAAADDKPKDKKSSTGAISWPNLQKSCKLMIQPKYTYTNHQDPNDVMKIGPNSSSPKDNKTLLELYTTPSIAFEIQNESEIMFLHALYALLDRNLGFIESNFANRVFNFFVLIEDQWEELINVIEFGKLSKNIISNEMIRNRLEEQLRPNAQRANELRTIKEDYDKWRSNQNAGGKGAYGEELELSNNNGNNSGGHVSSFARQIWPNLHTILAVETGAFNIYGEKLRKYWIGNNDGITIYSPLYAASEGLIGVNPNTKNKTFVLNPNTMFFEFIPVEDSSSSSMEKEEERNNECTTYLQTQEKNQISNRNSDQSTLFIEELDIGKEYELIITTLTGLYRYELGDVIRCVGYEGEAPIVEFAYRKGQFLNISGERTSEESFYKALTKTASNDWKVQLKEYTTVEYFNVTKGKNRKPKYMVYVEIMDEDEGVGKGKKPFSRKEMEMLDERLESENDVYGVLRKMGRLESVEVLTVKQGTFEKVKNQMLSNGVGATQIKQPRVTNNPELIKILEDGTYQ